MVESLRRADRTVLMVEGEGTVELDGGLLVETGSLFAGDGGLDPAFTISADGHDNERIIVAQWLRANADKVRVLESAGPEGMALPADRIPRLSELCAAVTATNRLGRVSGSGWTTEGPDQPVSGAAGAATGAGSRLVRRWPTAWTT